jgi:glutamate/tyrosine decarboxylase-like PLP-dependent enzyme
MKAARYFDVEAALVPIGGDLRADLDAMRGAIDDRTALLVGSAPNFPYGVVDPIEEIAALARDRGILCHVDACLGGFMLPFLERLGRRVPPFDFRVDGVTSMSADLHKFGYAAKGASTVLYRDRALRKHQFMVHTEWPGGLYGSPSMTGARGGAPIAAAWAVLVMLGEEGYVRLAKDAIEATDTLISGVNAIDGLAVMGDPVMTVFAFRGDGIDVYAVSEEMEARGWCLDRLQKPPALHLTVSPVHAAVKGALLGDLRDACRLVRAEGRQAMGSAAMYGALAMIPDRGQVEGLVLDFLDGMY